MADVDKSAKSKKINEVMIWRVTAWTIIAASLGAYGALTVEHQLQAGTDAAIHAAVSAATTPKPGK